MTEKNKRKTRALHKLIRNAVLLDLPVTELADILHSTPGEVLEYCIKNKDELQSGLPVSSPPQAYLNKYKITVGDHNTLYTEQQGCCKICGKTEKDNKRRLAIDHCHSTGTVRGLLCTKCNLMLGYAEDDTNVLSMAILYLEGRL